MEDTGAYIIHTDGGARGNPGPAAIGVVVEKKSPTGKNIPVHKWGRVIGETTNNVAEYTAVVDALKWLIENRPADIGGGVQKSIRVRFFLDSTLVVNQLNGLFKVKDEKMRGLMFAVRQLEQELQADTEYCTVPREQNSHADALVNSALDAS